MIRDNGYTFSKSGGRLDVNNTAGVSGNWVSFTGSLSQIQEWLEAALKEVTERIEEVG